MVGSMTKTVLVTGGAGFVGSHACKALARAGYLPVTFDNLERGDERLVKWGPLERGDLRRESDIARVFEARRPWAVMHFAAYAYVGESTSDPTKYYTPIHRRIGRKSLCFSVWRILLGA
jgi:UDP-arabinose 4-epimerase